MIKSKVFLPHNPSDKLEKNCFWNFNFAWV